MPAEDGAGEGTVGFVMLPTDEFLVVLFPLVILAVLFTVVLLSDDRAADGANEGASDVVLLSADAGEGADDVVLLSADAGEGADDVVLLSTDEFLAVLFPLVKVVVLFAVVLLSGNCLRISLIRLRPNPGSVFPSKSHT